MSHSSYFDANSLVRLSQAGGKTLQRVVCHLWINNIVAAAPVELIDNIQLEFADGEKLIIGSQDENTGLKVIDFDAGSTQKALNEEFGGKIKILAADASSTSMWKDITGSKLLGIQLVKEEENYLAESLMLDFGQEKRKISISPIDGLIVDYFEED
jgi:hypothetical protein